MQPDPDPQIEIIDNALLRPVYEEINSFIHSSRFIWRWSNVLEPGLAEKVNKYKVEIDPKDNYQLYADILNTNLGLYNQDGIELCRPILQRLAVGAPIRIKVNCCTVSPSGEQIIHGYHVDNPYPNAKTAILYLDDSNGFTQFRHNQQKVYSKNNRLVIFPSSLYHSGTSPTDQMRRMVININYFN